MTPATSRRICVLTGTRAEYGLVQWLMRDVRDHPDLALQVVATGAHLEPAFGHTVDLIEADGLTVDARVPIELTDDSPVGIAHSIGLAVSGIAAALARLAPDVVVLVGDRYEILAAATAALVARIPIAHVHGGEVTTGALDESMRHAVTKMAHLHYVCAEPYRRRVIQMGEQPGHVLNVGALGPDSVARLDLLDAAAVDAEIGLPGEGPLLLATYHPVTTRDGGDIAGMNALLAALDTVPDARVVLTKSNADEGGRAMNARLEEWAATRRGSVRLYTSMGHRLYLSTLRAADVVVGNSSSGVVEAPVVRTATVNIGARQDGRLRCPSVIDCAEDAAAITAALGTALDPVWRAEHVRGEHPFGDGRASERIVADLAARDLTGLARKQFHDLPGGAS